MLEATDMQPRLNLSRPHIRFGSEGTLGLALQDGNLFSMAGELLPFDVKALKRRGFSLTKPLRDQIISEQVRIRAEEAKRKIEAEMEAELHDQLTTVEEDISTEIAEEFDETAEVEL